MSGPWVYAYDGRSGEVCIGRREPDPSAPPREITIPVPERCTHAVLTLIGELVADANKSAA